MSERPHLAYLFSRYPLMSQTFCDNEMLGLESSGWDLVVGSIYPPEESQRQRHLDKLNAPVLYAPNRTILKAIERTFRKQSRWPTELIERHDREYGKEYQAYVRALNACYFAEKFIRRGVGHFHVPFANRAAHTALFVKEITGLPFSFTTHGQDFMVDLGSDELLAEMCDAAEFVVAVCDYSRNRLAEICSSSAGKLVRVYNGMDPNLFQFSSRGENQGGLKVISVGRLVEFKGFQYLIEAIGIAREKGIEIELDIVGTGPLQEELESLICELRLSNRVRLRGQLPAEEVSRLMGEAESFGLACIVDSKGASDLLPTVIAEAMFSGLPIVSTTLAGVPEMVVHGETGLLVEQKSPGAFANALIELALDPETRRKMGEAGRKRAEKLFSIGVTTPQLDGLLAESPPVRPASRTPKLWVLYDLDLHDREHWLRGECLGISSLGGSALVSGGHAAKDSFDDLGDEILMLEALPDGMVLEMEWRAREDWRRELEELRTEVAGAVDGSRFLRAARRAVWLAVRIAENEDCVLVGGGTEESVAVWLAGKLTGRPVAVCFDKDLTCWGSSLLRRVAKDSVAVSDATSKVNGAQDHLRRIGERTEIRRWGPIRLKRTIPEPGDEDRAKNIVRWLEKELHDAT